MPIIPDVIHSLDKIRSIHKSKNDDYAFDANPMFNFDVQEYVMKLFKNDRDKVFASALGNKLARLANLCNKNTEPNNEPLEDSFIDLATYTLLFKADRLERDKANRPSATKIESVNRV